LHKMRQVAFFAAALLFVAFAATVDGSLIRGRTQRPARSNLKDDHGTGYRLLTQFIAAVHYKNWTSAASLLSDDGMFMVSDYSCDMMNKTAFLSLLENDKVTASQVVPGTWVEADGATIMRAEVGNMGGDAGERYLNTKVFVAAGPNSDGTKLMWVEHFTDGSWKMGDNATRLMNAWKSLKAASMVGDLKTWDKFLNDTFTYHLGFAWDQYPMQTSNRSMFMDTLKKEYEMQTWEDIKDNVAFPACNAVFADFWVFKSSKDRGAFVQKFFLSAVFDDKFKLADMHEYTLGSL